MLIWLSARKTGAVRERKKSEEKAETRDLAASEGGAKRRAPGKSFSENGVDKHQTCLLIYKSAVREDGGARTLKKESALYFRTLCL